MDKHYEIVISETTEHAYMVDASSIPEAIDKAKETFAHGDPGSILFRRADPPKWYFIRDHDGGD
jgi:hypothetical protein